MPGGFTCQDVRSKVAEDGATLLYTDETGSSLKGVLGTTWAPVGMTPTLSLPTAHWDRVSVIGGVTRDGRVLTNTVNGSVNSAGVVAFLKYVLSSVVGEVIVVLDNARIHRSKLVKDFVASEERLEIVHTPPDAPETNPVEWLWAWVKRPKPVRCCCRAKKRMELAGLCARSVADLRAAWRRGLARVRARLGLVAGFFKGSALRA